MKTLTLAKANITEKILAKRTAFFSNIDTLSDQEIEMLSIKWHTKINRYQRFVAKIKIRQMEQEGYYAN